MQEEQSINAIIEVFPENGRVKSKTIIKPNIDLTKDQKRQLGVVVDEAQREGRNIWRQHHSGFMIRRECLIK